MPRPLSISSILVCPEINRKFSHSQYPIEEVILLLFIAQMCGCTDIHQIILFGKSQFNWLKKFSHFKNGVPSKEAIIKVLAIIDTEDFVGIVQKVIRHLLMPKQNFTITLTTHNSNSLQLDNLSLKHVSNNMLFRFPKTIKDAEYINFLNSLIIKKGVINFDYDSVKNLQLADNIIKTGGDYFVRVSKERSSEIRNELKYIFKVVNSKKIADFLQVIDGEVEAWKISIVEDLRLFHRKNQWLSLKNLIKIKRTNEKGKRIYDFILSSVPYENDELLNNLKNSFIIEESAYKTVTISLGTDGLEMREPLIRQNFDAVHQIVCHLLIDGNANKESIYEKMLRAGMDINYRDKLITAFNNSQERYGNKGQYHSSA